MLNIAVIEDNDRDAKILEQCLTRYATQNHLQFQVAHFSSALKFINAYKSNYDLIFMDIEMPLMSGMEAAKALRQIDRGVTLVFVTNMVQYAVEGYAVEAFDYILKPINDYAFDLKLKRILSHVGSQADRNPDGGRNRWPAGTEDLLCGGGRALSKLAYPGSDIPVSGNPQVHWRAAA